MWINIYFRPYQCFDDLLGMYNCGRNLTEVAENSVYRFTQRMLPACSQFQDYQATFAIYSETFKQEYYQIDHWLTVDLIRRYDSMLVSIAR